MMISTAFAARNASHEAFRAEVIAALESRGCVVRDRGVEMFFAGPMHRALLRCGRDDLTALVLRYLPDLAIVTPHPAVAAWFCEIKSSPKHLQTGNYSYELDSLAIHQKLAVDGCRVFVALHPGKACYAADIRIDREPDRFRADGSRTPFGVFRVDAPFLRPLDEFIRTELLHR